MSVRTLIIVESPNDAAFIRLLLRMPTETDVVSIESREVEIEDLHHVDGSENRGKNALHVRLQSVRRRLAKELTDLTHIGIVVDMDKRDDDGNNPNIKFVNDEIEKGFGINPQFTAEAEVKTLTFPLDGEDVSLNFSFFLMKDSTGEGHLDTVLQEIASSSNDICDCLNACIHKKTGADWKDYAKEWVRFYLKSYGNKKQRSRFEDRQHEIITARGAEIFDLQHPTIAPLRAYLAQFR